jgi:hypothetical protein
VRPSVTKRNLKQIDYVSKVSWSAYSDGQSEYETRSIVMGKDIYSGVMVQVS